MARYEPNNQSKIVTLILAAAAGAIYLLTTHVTESLQQLQVEKVPHAAPVAKPFDAAAWLQGLAPVWVERRQAIATGYGTATVDELFRTVPEPGPAPAPLPPQPNYAAMLPTVMHLDSIASNGAFINGKFYSVGEPITDFEYPANGRQVIPVIVRVGPTSVTVQHGNKFTELTV